MLRKINKTLVLLLLLLAMIACGNETENPDNNLRYKFSKLLDVAYTPDSLTRCTGWFTDAGSWMGFTLPEDEKWINGFCGPYSLDMNRRQWLAKSAVVVSFANDPDAVFTPDSTDYFPGELYMSASASSGRIQQRLHFVDASSALLTVSNLSANPLLFASDNWNSNMDLSVRQNTVTARHPSGEIVVLTFPSDVELTLSGSDYKAVVESTQRNIQVLISFYTSAKELSAGLQKNMQLLNDAGKSLAQNSERWNDYLNKVLRDDMKPEYDRIAVKAVVTLISNWRTHRGGLLHEGVVPSHAVGYFVGFWAWDSWRFSAALASFAPELAKNNIRAMFDYQLADGMIIDCIYTDPAENNSRNSKPPLVSWAVDEIFKHTGDTAFISEMYPQLLAYYHWWYAKRDNNRNGLCEYGSTDGTLEAAAWESGMDNAIRFDETTMLNNADFEDAWSMDQESVDLNAYLAIERKLLQKFARVLGLDLVLPEFKGDIAGYFYHPEKKFFFDRKINSEEFVGEFGCESYTPLWTGIASAAQVSEMLPVLTDKSKFSTYIPFPTVAADNPKYNPKGYWRGPVWLDQTYFAISGLRNYGYSELADEYTLRVFDRLQGLKENASIHENYGTHTGELLKAPHFSWSAAHLLMLYQEFGKIL